jgi:His/Glu/Gln/Arg/opine family amino acid ABC transporter permease subunit
MSQFLDYGFMLETLPRIAAFIPVTLNLTVVSMAIALVIGFVTALVRLYRVPLARQLATFYISFIRGTPLLVQMYLAYYGIPKALDYLAEQTSWSLNVSGIPTLVFVYFSLSLNVGAYLSETIRAAIEAVDKGQMEASLSVGMTRWQGLYRIVLPQAVTIALPNFGNTLISMLKDTSLAFMISVVEMMGEAKLLGARSLQFFEVYIVVALLYWGVCVVIERGLSALEGRITRHKGLVSAA